ncbi:MAG TPA: hypothetical protein VGH32_08095, partial [Pirellulales bacterium]
VVVPELYASLKPQTYEQDMVARDAEFRRRAESLDEGRMAGRQLAARAAAPRAPAAAAFGKGGGGFGGPDGFNDRDGSVDRPFSADQGVSSAAQASNIGELFQYKIETLVSLPRHESAMLPIVNASVKGQKVSIYNANVQAKYPLNGFKLTNDTDFHLMQGPITVFDGGAYAGDAEIKDIAPHSERLISYALDLDTEVATETKSHPEQLTSVRIVKGTLIASRKYERTQNYTVKNSGHHAKDVLVEYPHDPNWKLIEPKEPAEKTRDLYRFAVNAAPGKPVTLRSRTSPRTPSGSSAMRSISTPRLPPKQKRTLTSLRASASRRAR